MVAWVRLIRSVRSGVWATATVLDADFVPPELAPTLDAIEHGFASGRRVVHHPIGEFEEVFESDAVWAGAIEPGSIIEVLVHPRKREVLWDIAVRSPGDEGVRCRDDRRLS